MRDRVEQSGRSHHTKANLPTRVVAACRGKPLVVAAVATVLNTALIGHNKRGKEQESSCFFNRPCRPVSLLCLVGCILSIMLYCGWDVHRNRQLVFWVQPFR